jgi:hypothetical protein
MTPKGPALTDGDELLLRQIAPAFVVDGAITSAAFTPTRKDDGLLSVSRGSLVTPQQAWERHTRDKGLKSVGTWGVSVKESELPCHGDPTDDPPDDAHALIDFRGLSRGAVERRAKLLREVAAGRGCLYAPP